MASITTLLAHPEAWLVLSLAALGLVLLAWRLHLRWWPAFLLRALLVGMTLLALFMAIWEPFVPHAVPQRQVLIIDQSDSVAEETRAQALEQALRWQAEGAPAAAGVPVTGVPDAAESEITRSIVVFGSEVQPLLTGADQPADALPRVDGRASNLPGALKLAEKILGGEPGQVYLSSDGLAAQTGEVAAEAAVLAQRGQTLNVIPLAQRPTENDLALGGLIAPKNLWSGTPVDLLVPVLGAQNSAPQLRLKINGADSAVSAEPQAENPAPGGAAAGNAPASLYHFQIPSLPEGMVTLEVTVSSGPGSADPFPANNAAFTVLQVFSPPRVLLVTGSADTEAVTRFKQSLENKQIQLDMVAPDKLTTNLETLQTYQVVFLDNLLSNQLTREQMTALQVFVSKLAGGLVVLGGRNSYTLGGYEGTPIEAMLPVKLEPPPRTQRPPIVFQLILDRSSSMDVGDFRSTGDESLTPIKLAREAAMRSIETLQAEDYLGLLTFSDDLIWDIPLRPLGGPDGLRQAVEAVSRVEAVGSTNMYEAMQEAVSRVSALPADAPQSRHILLLSDGQSTDGSEPEFKRLATAAQARGITVSTIALGAGADEDVMQQIAEAGKGRFYAVENAEDLPRILIAESKAARSENVQGGETSLKTVEDGHPVLAGISPDQLPILHAYNALQSRAEEGAEDILVSSNFSDPVLSAWQYGLGRVAAWTSDLGEEWTADWQPEGEGAFWAQVVRYMLVDPAQSPAQASVQVEPTRLLVDAAVNAPDGSPINLAEVTFSYADAAGKTTTYRLPQKSAGVYQAELPRPPEGAYRAVLSYPGENGQTVEVPAPFAVNPPPEWLPQDPAAGAANLQSWAGAAGGQATTLQALLEAGRPAAPKPARPLADTWERLLLALVILWPLEIAIRRRWLPWME